MTQIDKKKFIEWCMNAGYSRSTCETAYRTRRVVKMNEENFKGYCKNIRSRTASLYRYYRKLLFEFYKHRETRDQLSYKK
jgi:hypothetical protein